MRIVAIVLAVGFLAVPASGQDRGECRKLSKQIIRYQGDALRAHQRGNELWEAATLKQIGHLSRRREERCPQYAPPEGAGRRLAAFLGSAAKAAAKYFTLGH